MMNPFQSSSSYAFPMVFLWLFHFSSSPDEQILQDLDDGHEVCRTNEVGKHLENTWKTPGKHWVVL